MEAFLQSPAGIWTCVGGGLLLAVLVLVVKNFRVRERKHLSDLAGALSHAGVPETYVTPISDLAVGDDAGAIGALIKAAQTLRTPEGWAALVKGIVMSAWADPTRKAALVKLLTDLQAGAPDSVISSDIGASIAANPLSKVIGTGPLATDFNHVADLAVAVQNNPQLAGILGVLGNVPAQVKAGLAKLLNSTPAPVPATTATLAPASAAAPAAPVSGGAASAAGVSSTPSVATPDGHVVIVAPPGTSIPAMQVPAAAP